MSRRIPVYSAPSRGYVLSGGTISNIAAQAKPDTFKVVCIALRAFIQAHLLQGLLRSAKLAQAFEGLFILVAGQGPDLEES